MTCPQGMSRCPACNPIHGVSAGGMGAMMARKSKLSACLFCEGKRLVPVECARRYVEGLQGRASSNVRLMSVTLERERDFRARKRPWS